MNFKGSGLSKDNLVKRLRNQADGLHTNWNTVTKQSCFRQAIPADTTIIFGTSLFVRSG